MTTSLFTKRWWRIAYSNPDDRRQGVVRRPDGRWRRVWRGWYWRLGNRRLRRLLLKWCIRDCPHERMAADILEGGGEYAVAWCPDCGRVRAVNRDPSLSGIIDRTPLSVTETSQYETFGQRHRD